MKRQRAATSFLILLIQTSAFGQNIIPDYSATQNMQATLTGPKVKLLELVGKDVFLNTTHKAANFEHATSSTLTEADVDYYDIIEICYKDVQAHKIFFREKSADKLFFRPDRFIILRCCPFKISDVRFLKFNSDAAGRSMSNIRRIIGFQVDKYQEGMEGCGIMDLSHAKCERDGGAQYPFKDQTEDAILRYIEYVRSKKKRTTP